MIALPMSSWECIDILGGGGGGGGLSTILVVAGGIIDPAGTGVEAGPEGISPRLNEPGAQDSRGGCVRGIDIFTRMGIGTRLLVEYMAKGMMLEVFRGCGGTSPLSSGNSLRMSSPRVPCALISLKSRHEIWSSPTVDCGTAAALVQGVGGSSAGMTVCGVCRGEMPSESLDTRGGAAELCGCCCCEGGMGGGNMKVSRTESEAPRPSIDMSGIGAPCSGTPAPILRHRSGCSVRGWLLLGREGG